jgi:hypothetical protein
MVLPELGPHEIHSLQFFLIMEEPPVPSLKQSPDKDGVVALAYEAFVLREGFLLFLVFCLLV